METSRSLMVNSFSSFTSLMVTARKAWLTVSPRSGQYLEHTDCSEISPNRNVFPVTLKKQTWADRKVWCQQPFRTEATVNTLSLIWYFLIWYHRISTTTSYHSYDLVAGMDFAQCNKVVSFYRVPGWTRKTYGRRYNIVALDCFNVCKFMHYCTYDLAAFFRYDLVVLTGWYMHLMYNNYSHHV